MFLIEEEYRLALARAEQSFVDTLIDRIGRGSPDFGVQWRAFHQERQEPT